MYFTLILLGLLFVILKWCIILNLTSLKNGCQTNTDPTQSHHPYSPITIFIYNVSKIQNSFTSSDHKHFCLQENYITNRKFHQTPTPKYKTPHKYNANTSPTQAHSQGQTRPLRCRNKPNQKNNAPTQIAVYLCLDGTCNDVLAWRGACWVCCGSLQHRQQGRSQEFNLRWVPFELKLIDIIQKNVKSQYILLI